MATVYYTVHIPHFEIPHRTQYAVLESRIYFFCWIPPKYSSSPTNEMEVISLDTDTFEWQRSTLSKEEGSEAVAPPPRMGHAVAAARGRIFMWGGHSEGSNTTEVLWWSPNESSSVAGTWRRLRLVDQRAPVPRRDHCLFSIDDRYLLLVGGTEISGRNSQDIWLLDLEKRQWKFVQAKRDRGLYLGEGASYCALNDLPVPRLYAFGCEMFRHHWNSAACLLLPGLTISKKSDDLPDETLTPSDHIKARWQRIVVRSSCSLQWKSPCIAMDECVYAFDILPGSSGGLMSSSGFDALSLGPLALWRLNAFTDRWEWMRIHSSPRAPLDFDTVAVVGKKVVILGRVCHVSGSKIERDLHIIDFAPTLQTFCVCCMARHGIDPSPLPPTLRNRVLRQCKSYFR